MQNAAIDLFAMLIWKVGKEQRSALCTLGKVLRGHKVLHKSSWILSLEGNWYKLFNI